ncbi:hypothetical protein [Bernardetia sp. MNP-M8]|uniref:hypothetical protein n=1 Tax=Bernardetia sp. MNP-M8 TaxID=3127470 RepID=UPI0030CE65F6
MLLVLLLVGSGFSLFALNFKRLFKPFTFLKLYSTLYMTIPLLVLFICNFDHSCSNSTEYHLTQSLSTDTPIYRQYNYEIYKKTGVLDFLNTCSGSSSNYYIDKNYFIFKVRLGYFHSVYEDAEFTFSEPLIKKEIENIGVKNDSIFIDFKDNYTRKFKLY